MPDTAFQNKSALLFVPNRGQTDEKARFVARINGHLFYFTRSGIAAVSYARAEGETAVQRIPPRDPLHDPWDKLTPVPDAPMRGAALFLTFEGAHPVEPQGQMQAAGRFHYFMGNDPANWRTMLPSFAQLQYAGLWDGVDLTLTGGDGGLKFLWTLKEARNVGAIRIRYEGAEEIRLSEDGGLLIRHALGELTDPAPVAWQEIGGVKKPVACAYALDGNTVSFVLTGAYDATALLFIDPILPYSTYLGGGAMDWGYALAVDSQGCTYVGGETYSSDFPTTPGAFQTGFSGSNDAFVSKFTPDGSALIYSTYIGGSGTNGCASIAVDSLGCVYITGYTTSDDYPTTPGAFQHSLAGMMDVIITKLSANGAGLVYSTLLGGSSTDFGSGIAIDEQGFAYVTGGTSSYDFPTTFGAFQTVLHSNQAAFVAMLSQNGAALMFSTFFDGTPGTMTEATAIAVDNSGCAYITGYTEASALPITPGSFQPIYGGGPADGFVTKFTPTGWSLVYSSFLGGTKLDIATRIAVDEEECAFVVGITESDDFFVTPGAFQTTFGGDTDAFITKISPSGGSILASTYLGGSSFERANSVAFDSRGNIYVIGTTESPDFPVTLKVVASSLHGTSDAFVSIFSPRLNRLLVSYYLGGNDSDTVSAIVVGADGAVRVSGLTSSDDFPVTPGAFQTVYAGNTDAFAVKEGFVLLQKASITLRGRQ